MQQPDRPLASRLVPVRRTAAAWLALVAAGGSCAVAPLAMAAELSCPSGQFAATRIEYEGNYNLSPTVDILNLHALVPNVGYKRRTVLVANGYYKEVSEGTIVVAKEEPPGKPVPLPSADNKKMYARELPSKFVIVETPQQKLVYDESGDPDHLGTRRNKSKQAPAADEAAIVGGLQAALGPSAGAAEVTGKATYAGIPCEMRKFLAPGNSVCIARLRGQYVTLAEEIKFPHRAQASRMQAKTKTEVCVSAREFEPPANVRFKPTGSSASRSR